MPDLEQKRRGRKRFPPGTKRQSISVTLEPEALAYVQEEVSRGSWRSVSSYINHVLKATLATKKTLE